MSDLGQHTAFGLQFLESSPAVGALRYRRPRARPSRARREGLGRYRSGWCARVCWIPPKVRRGSWGCPSLESGYGEKSLTPAKVQEVRIRESPKTLVLLLQKLHRFVQVNTPSVKSRLRLSDQTCRPGVSEPEPTRTCFSFGSHCSKSGVTEYRTLGLQSVFPALNGTR